MNRLSIGKCVHAMVLVLAVAGLFAAALCVVPARAADIDEAGKVLARLDDEWSAAAATRDAAKVASFYAEDVVAYPPGEPAVTGRAAAQKTWDAMFAEPSFNISWEAVHAEVAKSGELGFTAGTYQATFNGPDGKPVTEKGKFLCTWKKQKDGSWKAAHDMWNADTK